MGDTRSARAAAVVVAAGRGERFGTMDKILTPIAGQPMIGYILDSLERATEIGPVVLVVGNHTFKPVERLVARGPWTKITALVVGGARRQDSVANGVQMVSDDMDIVLIHDGARPLADTALFDACVRAARSEGAAIAATPVSDTIKRVSDGRRIERTVPRDHLWAAQTPQAFRRDALLAALSRPEARSQTFTDEAALFEALGLDVVVVPGNAQNLKITHPGDLAIVEALMMSMQLRVHSEQNVPPVQAHTLGASPSDQLT